MKVTTGMLTVGYLREMIEELPDDMVVCVYNPNDEVWQEESEFVTASKVDTQVTKVAFEEGHGYINEYMGKRNLAEGEVKDEVFVVGGFGR